MHPFELLVRGSKRPQKNELLLFLFDCLPEPEGKSLFLKIPHTSVTRLREIEHGSLILEK